MPSLKAKNPIASSTSTSLSVKNSNGLTLGDILKKISKIKATQFVYILLLIAVFLIGYLVARIQYLERGSSAGTGSGQQTGSQQAPAAPNPKEALNKVGRAHLPIKGNGNAKVSIVEFSDFECPFCARFFSDTLLQLTKEYIDTGKAKLDYRHFPLSFHPQAKPLAIASECANDQGKFWEMHDKIFTVNSGGQLASSNAETYKQWAAELGLNTTEFNSCLNGQKHAAIVDSDTKLGSELGVSGTPTFYINGRQLVGAQPYAAFKAIIDEELKK